MRNFCLFAALAATAPLSLAQPVAAREPAKDAAKPAPTIDRRIGQLVPLIKGEITPESYFSPTFLAAVPSAQFKAISASITAQYGQPTRIVSATPARSNGATVKLAFEKAVATVEVDVEPGAEGKVIGLLISGFEVTGDSLEAISAEFAALPGGSGFLLAALNDDGRISPIASRNPDQQFAIGSTFKLYILAQLASEVRAGKRITVFPPRQRKAGPRTARSRCIRWPDG
jgi:beta-lactamase class A